MKICLTGGAGYLGTALLPLLLVAGHHVTVLDKLLHGPYAMLPFFRNSKFDFIRGDVRDLRVVQDAVRGKDSIVHLAAIVGLPACNANPRDASSTNYEGSYNVKCSASGQRIIYASTVSIYGKVESGECTEETPFKPLSLYGSTKADAEKLLMEDPGTTALRFATIFGLSRRMRLDLLVNDLTHQAVRNKSAIVYQPEAVRSVLHVLDAANAICATLGKPSMAGQVYNVVGANLTKRGICAVIKKETGAYFHFADVGEDGDGRDAAVNGEKIKATGWTPQHSLEEGVHEMARAFAILKDPSPYSNA